MEKNIVKPNTGEVITTEDETAKLIELIDEEGKEIIPVRSFGCGTDVHRDFIAVSVLVRNNGKIYEFHRDFKTDLKSLAKGKEWVFNVIRTKSDPQIDIDESNFSYTLESTSVYHLPVILTWGGVPSLINPALVGNTRRKTDNLDAAALAYMSLTGVWKASYIPSADIQVLRLLIAERNNFNRLATRCSNRINNGLLRFGYTIGRAGSVTTTKSVRKRVEEQLGDNPRRGTVDDFPFGIPDDVKCVFKEEYRKFDEFKTLVSEYNDRIRDKVYSMEWETADGTLPGKEMLKILTTAPGIGEQTAITWLANIMTPRRFPNAKACSAYCGLDPSLKVSAGKVTSTVKRGGNKDLHTALNMAASNLIRRHSDPFGMWGYNLYKQTGKWKKATNALSRRLCVSLYYMASHGEPFSYEKYKIAAEPDTIDIPIEKLAELNPEFKRYVRILIGMNIKTTTELVHEYYICNLNNIRGLGVKFYGLVKDFINEQAHYRKLLRSQEK